MPSVELRELQQRHTQHHADAVSPDDRFITVDVNCVPGAHPYPAYYPADIFIRQLIVRLSNMQVYHSPIYELMSFEIFAEVIHYLYFCNLITSCEASLSDLAAC